VPRLHSWQLDGDVEAWQDDVGQVEALAGQYVFGAKSSCNRQRDDSWVSTVSTRHG
jgi:hypothetical protein